MALLQIWGAFGYGKCLIVRRVREFKFTIIGLMKIGVIWLCEYREREIDVARGFIVRFGEGRLRQSKTFSFTVRGRV